MLQGYQFEVVHVPGTRNELPDYLSRNPEHAMEEDQPTEDENQHPLLNQIQERTLYEEIAAAQREDDSCQQDKARLQRLAREEPADADERRIREEYALVDDCIWKRTPQQLLLYVPRTLRRRLLEEYHDGPHAAHPGWDETQTAIQQKFWWPKLPRNVAEWVKSCAICAAVKAGPPQSKAPLRPRTPPEPWHTVSLDVLGPYEEAPRHARYAAVLTDTFTKWVELKPIPTTQAQEIVQFLEETFTRYGYPACIVTDAARPYLAARWTNYLEQHHIQGYTSPIYHQRANPVERRIQELMKTIRALVIEQPHRWPEALPNALFALHCRTNAATGTSPAVLMFGQPIRRPGEWTMPVEVRPLVEPHNERIARPKRRQEVYQRQLCLEPREASRRYQVGDLLLTRMRPGNPPFAPKWSGPHRVMEVLGDGVYVVDQNDNAQLIHIDDIRSTPPPRNEVAADDQGDPEEPVEPAAVRAPADEEPPTITPNDAEEAVPPVPEPDRTPPATRPPEKSATTYPTRVWRPSSTHRPSNDSRPIRRRSRMIVRSPSLRQHEPRASGVPPRSSSPEGTAVPQPSGLIEPEPRNVPGPSGLQPSATC
ncbi:uncharacterized protein K02A2.6-like [Anoplophora glabripennis]|uniref:uncharacterized protein K02A2.6-like n=1 Tax=Anoplophora glabripennis TaxID=217634 RepID=UPI000C78618D|nr:uncharacterized protein K02A2.6-like [Anoplophora glabripennis]